MKEIDMTKTTVVKWLKNQQFVGTDSSKHSVVMSTQDQDNGIGITPSELLLLSLGGCTSYDMINILTKKRQQLTALEITVTGEQEADPPWKYTEIHVHYCVRGRDLSEKAVRDAIRLSNEKYCSVAATLRDSVQITHDYELVQDTESQ
jgi:putative redox protein